MNGPTHFVALGHHAPKPAISKTTTPKYANSLAKFESTASKKGTVVPNTKNPIRGREKLLRILYMLGFLFLGYASFGQRISGASTVNVNTTSTYYLYDVPQSIAKTSWGTSGGSIVSQSNTSVTVRWSAPGNRGVTAAIWVIDPYGGPEYSANFPVRVNGTVTKPPTPAAPAFSKANCLINNVLVSIPSSTNPPTGVTWYWQGTNPNGTSRALPATGPGQNSFRAPFTNGRYYLRAYKDGLWSVSSSSVQVTLSLSAGTIRGNETICGSGNPGKILSTSEGNSNVSGYSHQWQQQTGSTSSPWVDAPGA